MKHKKLFSSIGAIIILDYIGNRFFELYRYNKAYPTICFTLIVASFLAGYYYWKSISQKWVQYVWCYLYLFIIGYYSFNWLQFLFGYSNNGFLYKTYVSFGLSPLTFGFVYLISKISTSNSVKND